MNGGDFPDVGRIRCCKNGCSGQRAAKYLIVWELAETACIYSGISFNGEKDGYCQWDGLCNFRSKVVLFGRNFRSMVEGFNINTNQWVARYVFKRLRFMGNKHISHISTMLFLAIWHGFYAGYFITFGLEFVIMLCEAQFSEFCVLLAGCDFKDLSASVRLPLHVLFCLFRTFGCAFCSVPFLLLRWRRIKIVFASLSYWMVAICICWLLVRPVLMKLVRKPKDDKKKE